MEPIEGYSYRHDVRLKRKLEKSITTWNLLIALICILLLISITMDVTISTRAANIYGCLKSFVKSSFNITRYNCSDLH